MTLYLDDGDVRLYHGDVMTVLAELPAESVDCVVTSPPYWGLRDYSVEGQLGLEPTPDQYITRMVEVFREVRRVLKPSGTLWLNIGDSYNAGTGGRQPSRNIEKAGDVGYWQKAGEMGDRRIDFPGLKIKDLCGIPWRLAFALQADGWYLRADIIWAKPNPMPESVTDRPTKAHEYVFLLTRQPRYFFDQEAVREQFEARPQQRLTDMREQPLSEARRAAGVEQGNPQGGTHASRFRVQDESLDWCGCVEAGCGRTFGSDDCGCACHTPEPTRGPDGRLKTTVQASNGSIQHRDGERWPNAGRNVRTVWEIPTQPYPEAHFATFPEELVRRCILAGCPERGLVLDPFAGSGTTLHVARKHGRHAIGIELNADYCALAARRLQQLSLLSQ
jgi:DNA modification methylase